MLRVPGHHVETVASRCSGNQTITCGNDLTGFLRNSRKFSPSVAGFKIDREQSIRVVAFERLQPSLKFPSVLAFSKKRNPFGDLSD